MILGLDFTILSIIITITLLPLYIYRKKVFRFLYKKENLQTLLRDMEIFLKNTCPKIKFDFSKVDIKDKTISADTKKVLIIESALNQYINFVYNIKTQVNINKDLIWGSYEIDSIPKKNSTPKDLLKRKDLTFKRDNEKCNRCGKKIKMDTSMLFLLKDIDAGGTYHFENLTVLCNDCYKVVNSKNPQKLLNDLHLSHILKKKYLN